ncbi:hypothetical protein [Rubrivirga sp.]|uniref:hypothetical protein n=1 Tax=Rubrivirga sp. TaxID=1885344 RepID=UPI003B51F999
MTRRLLAPLALVALLVLSACDGGGPDPIGVTGTWEGVVFRPDAADAPRYPIEIRMTDTGTRITGSGVVEGLPDAPPDGRFEFVIGDGSFVNGNLTLSIRYEDRPPFMGTIAGVLSNEDPAEIRGTMDGAGAARGNFVIELRSRSA